MNTDALILNNITLISNYNLYQLNEISKYINSIYPNIKYWISHGESPITELKSLNKFLDKYFNDRKVIFTNLSDNIHYLLYCNMRFYINTLLETNNITYEQIEKFDIIKERSINIDDITQYQVINDEIKIISNYCHIISDTNELSKFSHEGDILFSNLMDIEVYVEDLIKN